MQAGAARTVAVQHGGSAPRVLDADSERGQAILVRGPVLPACCRMLQVGDDRRQPGRAYVPEVG